MFKFLFVLCLTVLVGELQAATTAEYILYLRADGGKGLGAQLDNFWSDVKKQKLDNPPVKNYPPHCSLTGFYTGHTSSEGFYISELQKAIKGKTFIIKITKDKIKETDNLDYIPLSSSDLLTLTKGFVKSIKKSQSIVKARPGTFGYHITLRQNTVEPTTSEVKTLEDQDINLTAKNLKQNTSWSLFIYRKETSGKLTKIFSTSIKTKTYALKKSG